MGLDRKMRAVVMEKADGDPVWHHVGVQEVEQPAPSANEVLVRIEYAAFNHRDLFCRRSLYPGVVFPSILGADAVGTVVEPSTSPLRGKRVLIAPAENWLTSPLGPDVPSKPFGILGGVKQTKGRGTFAEYLAVASDHVVELPRHLEDDLPAAAGFPLCGLTAYRAVFTKAGVQKGQHVLITGIGGGVAIQALQYCVALEAKVWVTSGDQAKIDKAKSLGARGGVSYRDKDWPKQLQALLPRDDPELDIVIDSGGGSIVSQVLRLLKFGGKVVQYGNTQMDDTGFGIGAILKNIELKGSTMGSLEEFKQAVDFVGSHKIVPVVHTVLPGLEKIDEAFTLIDDGKQTGKVVIQVAGANPKL